MPDLVYIIFLFILGSCIGSFLNVVVYRLPLGLSIVSPPSRCPQCETLLAWCDNIPVLGWIMLGGKCRYCKKPISSRYPIVEAFTGLLFAFYYVMLFRYHAGPCHNLTALGAAPKYFAGELTSITTNWPIYSLYMLLISGLLAASLIDAELFIIPTSIPWLISGIAIVAHAAFDRPHMPGALLIDNYTAAPAMAISSGALLGLIISIVLLWRRILPLSFPQGDLLEIEREEIKKHTEQAQRDGSPIDDHPPEYTPAQVRAEIRKEMIFLMPPLALAGIFAATCSWMPGATRFWQHLSQINWANAALASILGAMIAGFTVWLARILGSYAFGREAMGLGDVHLMLAVGAVLGGGAAIVAFFLAPFFGMALAVYMFIAHRRRQLPYGPYLSLATAFVMLFYCPIAAYFRPGIEGLVIVFQQAIGHGS